MGVGEHLATGNLRRNDRAGSAGGLAVRQGREYYSWARPIGEESLRSKRIGVDVRTAIVLLAATMNAFLADLVVIIHFAIVLFMVVGLLLILLGGLRRWRWVRNPWFRLSHLGIMAYIAFNARRGELCFLTLWERDLRREAGQRFEEEMSFIGQLFREALYVDVPQRDLDKIYMVFAAVVMVSMLAIRPRFRRAPVPPALGDSPGDGSGDGPSVTGAR